MCCYSKLCKDGSNSVCLLSYSKLSSAMDNSVSNNICVASKLCKDEVTVYVLL